MCGLCGFLGNSDPATLRRMLEALRHRGPDASGVYMDRQVNLGSCRLRIIDLQGGDQPIFNETRDVAVVYNGEIYNFVELREELRQKGHCFETRSDTEVLVHLYEEYGDDLPVHLNGIFAFALWDRRRERLLLARDQVGVKPLCYWWDGSTLVFASEVKAILRHPLVSPRLDPDASHLLLNLRFVPAPRTLFQGVHKLLPGHVLTVDCQGLRVRPYWHWDWHPDESLSADQWAEGCEAGIAAAVHRQLVSDVPVGAFLSGGLDSSTIVACATQAYPGRLQTFSLGFGEPTDELPDARAVAAHFGTEHHETTLSGNPLAEFPRVIYHVEEPKVNALQGYFLSRLAADRVKVALSGLGGDELFAGYEIHRYLQIIESCGAACPRWLSRLATAPLMRLSRWGDRTLGLPFENWRRGLELIAGLHDPTLCYSVLRNAWDLDQHGLARVYSDAMRRRISVRTRDYLSPFFERPLGLTSNAMWAEFNLKLVDDFLHNEDRVSMAHSLEVRVPLLDRDVIQQALRIPLRHHLPRGHARAILKQAVQGRLPPSVLRKRKRGFSFNPHLQFTKDLRRVAEQVLASGRLDDLEIFNPRLLRAILDHPPSALLHWHYFLLWMAVGLHFWHEIFIAGRDVDEVAQREAVLKC